MPRSITQMRSALPYWVSILSQEFPQRGLIHGVSRQHFIGQRKALRRHHQRDDHLHAVRALVAAVAIAALVFFIGRPARTRNRCWSDRKAAPRTWHRTDPANALQMTEQRRLVFQQLCPGSDTAHFSPPVNNPAPRRSAHRALLKPQPVKSPLAPGIDQPIANKRLQNMAPTGALAGIRQARSPRTRSSPSSS